MIKIDKVKGERIAKCEVDLYGYQFEFSVVCENYGYYVEGSEKEIYREFERNIDTDDEILRNLQDVMYEIAKVYGN